MRVPELDIEQFKAAALQVADQVDEADLGGIRAAAVDVELGLGEERSPEVDAVETADELAGVSRPCFD